MSFFDPKLTRWALLALLGLAVQARATLPQTLNYQGRMRNFGAGPVTDSTGNTVVFKLYDAPQTSVLWTETWDSGTQCVTTKDGLFNVVLGTFVPLTLAFDQQYYLEIKFNGDPPMTPRLPLTMAPYAFNANSVVAPLSLSSSAFSATLTSRNYNSLNGAGVIGRGLMMGVSAVADASGGTGMAAFALFGNAIYGRNYGGGSFVPSILGEATGTGMGVIGRSLSGGGQGSLGGSLSGGGSTGVNGKGGAGGVGVSADQGPGTYALQTNGDTRFDGTGNTATFNTYVSFTAGTNLSASVAAPLSLTFSSIAAAPLSVSNATGTAILAQGVTGVVASGSGIGLIVQGSAPTGISIASGTMNTAIDVNLRSFGNAVQFTNSGTGYALSVTNALSGGALFVNGIGGNGLFANSNANAVYASTTGSGTYGTWATNTNGGTGIRGESYNPGGIGIWGNGYNLGVSATATGPSALGLYAYGLTGTVSVGTTLGLSLTATSITAQAIYARVSTTAAAVEFINDSTGPPLKINAMKFPANDTGHAGHALISSDGAGTLAWAAVGGASAPLSLTLSSIVAAPLSVSNATGLAVLAQGVTGLVATGASIGVSATASGAKGIAGYFQAVTGLVAAGTVLGVSATASNPAGYALYASVKSTNAAIFGTNSDGSGAGIWGTDTGPSNSGSGVYGSSVNNVGLYGTSGGSSGIVGDVSNTASGVYGQNQGTGSGVYGINQSSGLGVRAYSVSGTGLYAEGGVGIAVSGTTMGLSATASGPSGYGVFAAVNSTNAALFGNNGNANGIGVFGQATGSSGHAVVGQGGQIGVSATAAFNGIALYARGTNNIGGSAAGIVINDQAGGAGFYGYATGVGVMGSMTITPAVSGVQSGVYGYSAVVSGSAGVYGNSAAAGGYGVLATNAAGFPPASGAALMVNGLMKVQANTKNDTNTAGTLTSFANFNAPSGQIIFASRSFNTTGYGPITNSYILPTSVVLATFAEVSATFAIYQVKIPAAGGSFSVMFNGTSTITAGDTLNFVVINQ